MTFIEKPITKLILLYFIVSGLFFCKSWGKFWDLSASQFGLVASPADGATSVSRNSPLTLAFAVDMDVSSLTVQNQTGSCSGSVQLSADNFVTCNGGTLISSSNSTFVIAWRPTLLGATTYKLRLTTALRDSNGTALSAIFTQTIGFTTRATAWAYVTDFTANNIYMYTINPNSGALAVNGTIAAGAGTRGVCIGPRENFSMRQTIPQVRFRSFL